jgi:hypothetical protein
MEITGIGYIGLESTDAKSCAEYGPQVLGLGLNESRDSDDGAVYLRMDDRHHRIVVRPGERPRMAYVGWDVADHYAFEEGLKALHDAGHPVSVGDADLEELRGVHGVAQFKDPAGIDHEIFYGQWYDPGSFVPGRRLGGFMASAPWKSRTACSRHPMGHPR